MSDQQPYVTIRSRRPADANGGTHGDFSAGVNGSAEAHTRSATHDISRTSFHVKHISQFAQRLEDSATRAFPNRGRASQRYTKVQALLLHWGSDDLFVLPELEDLEKCLRDEYAFGTDIFAIPSENSHLELMMRLGQLIKEHESQDTLFIIYYGGHARIDDSRQSTWCATRDADSPWLQWSAIQTLLERSKSDVLILLDCCAGAASATFPNGNSITETISASSWDAIAPDPGRYSFTNALIEVLQEWRLRAFSAAMLHAEVLARLKHPRPIQINGKHFEARSTPVHFMMTANHKAPSIEFCRLRPADKVPAPLPQNHVTVPITGRAPEEFDPNSNGLVAEEPNEDTPHVMISLALEDDQRLDINAWEQWLNAFPALAKFVKVQGVFKSHSTLLLVSMPVMVWDLLPEDNAVSFVAFIRSNNLAIRKAQVSAGPIATRVSQPHREQVGPDDASIFSGVSGTTFAATEAASTRNPFSATSMQMILNQQQSMRRTTFGTDVPDPKRFSPHVERRLEEYYQREPLPSDGQSAFFASNLGIEPWHLEVWFHHRRERDMVSHKLAAMRLRDVAPEMRPGPQMILPADLSQLLEMSIPGQVALFDLRSPSEYQRSHIYGAINLRAPQSFLESAPLELIERAFPQEHGQSAVPKWRDARCLVFYARGLESPWECPAARIILGKLNSSNWSGKCFILKGHYREFSQSFDRYIVGTSMTDDAKSWIDGQETKASSETDTLASHEQYAGWLSHVESEDRGRAVSTSPTSTAQRLEILEAQDRELEREFKSQHGALFRKAEDLKLRQGEADDAFDTKARFVEPLDRGLDKIRGLGAAIPPVHYAPGHTKVESEGFDRAHAEDDDADDYVEVSRADDSTPGGRRAGNVASREARTPGSELPGRGRGGGSLLNKMFRR
ncbi:anaphase-promoting complex component Cut20/Apc4 [Purpureocillium lavendulum]|uniref:Anaphase-promoting complex component Cut20/Apc4 n=1 Tax=Purpureocillium lavendulum TaxID=1247861 RepID=A0AB34FZZ8_9HYPO|nr:anaphase-promoting complex component Cut20/Apc4 [Purpureocillium lavendulum]